MDIVERLRSNADERFAVWQVVTTMSEAADEIERLREALKFYADPLNYEHNMDAGELARSALQQKESE